MTTATGNDLFLGEVERFIVEVDALATFESIRSGSRFGESETWLVEHIYGLLDEFEKVAGFGNLSEKEANKLHERGVQRGQELFAEFVRVVTGGDDAR